VMVEGEGVVRHMDMGTHNHASDVGNTPPWMDIAKQAVPGTLNCSKPGAEAKCELSPFSPDKCPKGKTPHHIVPAHSFLHEGENNRKLNLAAKTFKGQKVTPEDIEKSCLPDCEKYRVKQAPCVCVTGRDKSGAEELGKEESLKAFKSPDNQLQHGWI